MLNIWVKYLAKYGQILSKIATSAQLRISAHEMTNTSTVVNYKRV